MVTENTACGNTPANLAGIESTFADESRLPGLLPHHTRELRDGSGLSDETIKAAGILSIEDRTVLARITNRENVPLKWGVAWALPYYNELGEITMRVVKFDNPPLIKGKPLKYMQPRGQTVQVYFSPGVRALAKISKQPLFITEGGKKGLKLSQEGFPTIALSGVDCWHKKKSNALLPELAAIDWKDRPVYIVFDSDAASNEQVRNNANMLAAVLQSRGAIVKSVRLPAGPNGEKVGADDYLVAHGPDAFHELLATAEEPEPPDPGSLKQPAIDILPEFEAAAIIDTVRQDELSKLRYWNDGFYLWRKGCYVEQPDAEVKAAVIKHLNAGFTGVGRNPIANVFEQLRGQAILSSRLVPPAWIGEPAYYAWKPQDLLVMKNTIVHLPSIFVPGVALIAGSEAEYRIEPTPKLFCLSRLDFDFVPEESCPMPELWLKFLDDLWPNDPESIQSLQQWFGYLLTDDTSQQKIMTLIGPPRSGKGTVLRILAALLGSENIASPSLSDFSTNFGLWPLYGKRLATISDLRLSGRSDKSAIVEKLLSISGEDYLTIDRKFRSPITCKLPTRIMIVSNELPRLPDASQALAKRIILLQLKQNWFGREDTELTKKLLAELPGILWWAIVGWNELRKAGRLLQPKTGQESLQELTDLSSPISAFVRDCCEVASHYSIPRADLYVAYKEWCEGLGRTRIEDEAGFGRNLRAAVPGLSTIQPREGGKRIRHYAGIGLKN